MASGDGRGQAGARSWLRSNQRSKASAKEAAPPEEGQRRFGSDELRRRHRRVLVAETIERRREGLNSTSVLRQDGAFPACTLHGGGRGRRGASTGMLDEA